MGLPTPGGRAGCPLSLPAAPLGREGSGFLPGSVSLLTCLAQRARQGVCVTAVPLRWGAVGATSCQGWPPPGWACTPCIFSCGQEAALSSFHQRRGSEREVTYPRLHAQYIHRGGFESKLI